MKKRILLLTLLLCGLFGCKYDDGPILDKVNDLEGRVSRLEVACGKLNQDLVALQKVVTLLQDNDYVTSVTPLIEQGQQVGYTLTFAKGGPVSIRDGKNGLNGKDGTNGTNGKDGHTPALGVKADSDGIYYWTVDGEWLLTADGQKVRAEGNTPQLKIENEYWYVSTDSGINWHKMGRAVSPEYISLIKEVKVEDDRILVTLASNEEIAVPRVSSKALWIEAPDSKEVDFRIRYFFTIDYRIVNGAAPTLLRVEVSSGLKVLSLGQHPDGLRGRLDLAVTSDEVTRGLVVIKVCDANGQEAAKVVTLTQATIDPAGTEISDSTPIIFRDLKAKKILLEYCDYNSDGEISYAEASRKTSLPNDIFMRTTIKSLDELQYFTSLEYIPDFRECMCLTSVVIPKGVKTIGSFARCKNLTQMVIPEGVRSIVNTAFFDCENLRTVVIPESVIGIGDKAFMGCESLTHIVIPEGAKIVGRQAFEGCKNLKYIKLPSRIWPGMVQGMGLTPSTTIIVPKGAAEYYSRFFPPEAGFKIVEE